MLSDSGLAHATLRVLSVNPIEHVAFSVHHPAGTHLETHGAGPRCLQYLSVAGGTRIISATSFSVNTFSMTLLLTYHAPVTALTPISTEGAAGWTGSARLSRCERLGGVA